MKSFNFSKKFEQVTSLVLAIMLLLSVFTASNVAVFADSNNKSTKTKNSDSEVNLYVKSDVQPFIKSSSDSEYKIISKTNAEDDYYSAKVKKSSSASTADTANITYRLANFSVDNNKVYFIKPSNWNIDNYKIYAYVWDGANNFTKEMSVVKSTEKNNFYCEENNTLSHLNNADKNELYYADFSNNSNYKNYKNILFFANETGVVENNPQMKTDDFELNYGSVYFGNDKNYACKTIGNIKEVGSQFTATDDMIVSVQDNNISILKESDLNIDIVDSYHRVQLRNGIQISFWKYKSDVHFECSKYDTEKFGELTYYYTENNVEKIIDGGKLSEIIKNNDVNVIVKLGNIPLKIYTNVKVNTGLTIDSIKWNYKTNVNSHISGNNVYVPSSCEKFELAVDSLEITGAKLNGEKLEGEALKGINIIDKNISNSQTVYQKDKVENTVENTFECQIKEVKYLGETYKYPINDLYNFNFTDTVNSHFVDVSVTVDDNYGKYAFIDSENNYIYQNGSEKCKYIVTPTSNDIKTDEITVISNSGKISYEKGIITVQQGLTEDTEFTVKYPHEDGFEVKTYTIKPDNDAPEIESIVFTKKENDTLKNYGLYSSDEIEFKITIKDKDNVNVAGVDNEALSCADDYFEINPPEYNETDKTITYTCILNKSITSSDNKIFNKIFKVKDKVSNSAEYSLSDLIDKNNTKVSVGDEEIINESFEVVSNSNDKNIEVKNTFNGDNYDDEKHIIGSGKEVSVTSVISDKLSGINNIGNFKCTYSDGTSVNITDVSGKDLSGVDTVAYSYVDNGETTKTTEVELKYTIKTENSGKYELSYTVTNNSGVKKDVSETFYVDNTAPNVTNVDFVKTSNPSVSDQILNFLTFGIYSNDTIVMKVTATDSAPTSGFDKIDDAIEVVDGNGIKIEKADSSNATKNGEVTNTAASNATQESNVTYSFELGNSDDLSFTVKDNANNVNENIALADLVKDNKVKANDNSLTEEQLKNVSNVFEVVSSTKKPTAEVSSYNATGTKAFNDNNIYHGDQLTVTLNLNNDISGLQSISDLSVRGFESSNFSNFKLTKINGKDQSFSANSFDELAAEFKNQATNEKVKSATVTFDINIKDNPNYSESHKLSLTVTDNIGNVNTEVVNSTFYVDNTAPEITKVEFVKTTNPTVTDQILNFLTFGIYSNDTIVMNVTALDNAPTSGLPSDSAITVKNDNKENLDVKEINDEKLAASATENSTVTYSYNLDKLYNAYKLSFTVKDNDGNTEKDIDLITLIKNKKVIVNGYTLREEQLDDISKSFEVLLTNKNDLSVATNINGINYGDDSNIIVSGAETKVESTVNLGEDLTGAGSIGNFRCAYYQDPAAEITSTPTSYVTITHNNNDFTSTDVHQSYVSMDRVTKDQELKFDYVVSTEKSGKYVLTYTVINNAGVEKTVDKTFYVDNTAPEITKVEFVKTTNPTVTDQILNFLTFGIYSNDTIVMNVTALDNAPTSGLPSDSAITVKNDNKENLDVKEKKDEKLASNATDSSTVTYSYNLGNSDSAYVLSFTVKDNAGNTATKSLVDLIKEDKEKTEKVVVANANITKVDYDKIEGFEVVSNNDSTKIDAKNTFEGTNFDDNSNPIIRSGDTVSVVSNIKDQFTGINKIGGFSCKWNDSENVKITDNDNNLLSSETFSYDYVTDKKTTDVTLNYNISTKESGKYVLTYTVTNNAGVKKTFDETFYVDNTAPVIRDFTFENGKTAENPDSVIKTEYGYYFKNTTTVEVTAVDGEVDSLVSGVSEIHFYTIEKGKTAPSNIQEVLVSGYNQTSYKATTFEVPANFKGNVYAYAVDKAGNCYNFDTTTNKNDSQPVTPDRVVVENSSKHEQMSGIDISLPATNYVENSNKLYNNDVNVALNVSDTYSGIAKIEYSVSSEFDKDNNWDGSIKYLNDQSAETNMNGNGTVSGWKIEESDQNLVTKASSTITVKNNSNNIKIEVKLTDRAGNVSTKKETLSIDKTKPTIKIEYDNNNHTTHNGTEFYKANRTATITVTERNFSPEDVISKITNADNVITQITGWTTHNVANGENPDGTTHTATVVYASDGDYTFDIAFTDMAGNKADKVAQHKFTIDKTIPVISVSFDNNSAKNNNYFKADRTATITVNEHNFNAADVKVNISATGADNSTSATAPSVSSWTNNGNVHTATISFAKDGKYAFDVNYTDLADNAAKENVVTTFYVDKTAPTVKISNVVNESANSGNVAPVISLSDNNYSGDYVLSLTRVDINAKKTDVTNDFASTVAPTNNIGAVVTYANFASEEVNDGIYVLNATLTDKAGNSSADTITFSVNRFGSTYMGGDEETNALLDNGYTNAEKDIVISEINVDKLTKSNISLSLDSSSLKTLKQNVDYTIQEDTKTGQWHRYNYTVKSSNFENEGNYTLELSSTDAAKNTSTNRIRPVEKRKLAVQFVVDKTSPVVNIAGIENNALYEENSKDVTIVCEDSYINPSSLVINLDNKTLKEGKDYTVEKDVASITAKIKVNATSDISSQNIKVSVKDMAQNSGDGSVENFTLSATVLMRFFANPVLVIISAVILAGIIVMVVLIVAKKRKNN